MTGALPLWVWSLVLDIAAASPRHAPPTWDAMEQATRLLAKAGKIYVADPGAKMCFSWNVRPASRGAAEISRREEDGDVISYFVELSLERGPLGDGFHPVLIQLGPTITHRKGPVRSTSIGSGEQLWLGPATGQYVEVGDERWFFDRATCWSFNRRGRTRTRTPAR
jgi:hypothetical protein